MQISRQSFWIIESRRGSDGVCFVVQNSEITDDLQTWSPSGFEHSNNNLLLEISSGCIYTIQNCYAIIFKISPPYGKPLAYFQNKYLSLSFHISRYDPSLLTLMRLSVSRNLRIYHQLKKILSLLKEKFVEDEKSVVCSERVTKAERAILQE